MSALSPQTRTCPPASARMSGNSRNASGFPGKPMASCVCTHAAYRKEKRRWPRRRRTRTDACSPARRWFPRRTANADPRDGVAVLLGGKHYVMQKTETERLAAAGVEFVYLFDHDLPDGRNIIMTVPVN